MRQQEPSEPASPIQNLPAETPRWAAVAPQWAVAAPQRAVAALLPVVGIDLWLHWVAQEQVQTDQVPLEHVGSKPAAEPHRV